MPGIVVGLDNPVGHLVADRLGLQKIIQFIVADTECMLVGLLWSKTFQIGRGCFFNEVFRRAKKSSYLPDLPFAEAEQRCQITGTIPHFV